MTLCVAHINAIKTMGKENYISEIPDLMKEWDWKANANLDPSKITYGSGQKLGGYVLKVIDG